MILKPEDKVKKGILPSLKDYKKNFIVAGFTIGMALTPIMMTSCMGAQRPPVHKKSQTELDSTKKVNSKTEAKTESKVEDKTITPAQKLGEIKKPEVLGGVPAQPIHEKDGIVEPCDTDNKKDDKKDDKKDTSTNNKDEEIKKPRVRMGKMKIPDHKIK